MQKHQDILDKLNLMSHPEVGSYQRDRQSRTRGGLGDSTARHELIERVQKHHQ
ncbi:MAG TPA: hypothetical protein PLK21_05760 [Candidatus Syntrophosphaera sp.]|nr:hypothetical protein [Candidatus Cloacimonadota bacterium]HNU54869.1 hypothetical protein [Candidatus Syntrophosphaera sp.]HOH48865.1 hypothetical protein [Candidatus Syntrophosphaera sp.]HPB43628.1 hypothetical protein [Candidatus Syntrophosphaera sp.]HPW38990.1 hypothetical protein [Candidatus Syntrophosphaera sp.]